MSLPGQTTLRGRIDYLRNATGLVSGREWFSITRQRDGGRILRAQCEMDDIRLLRDVSYAVDRAWRPLEAHVRLVQDDAFVGSAFFRFTDTAVLCEAFTASEGRISQSVPVAHRPPVFAAHPIVNDGWQTMAFDHSDEAPIQWLRGAANSSPRADGGSGPMIGITDKRIEYVGETPVSVPAGTFDCRHYRIHPEHFDSPLELYVSGSDCLLVRLEWAHLDSRYDLAELEQS